MFRTRLPLVATLLSATFLLSFLPAQSATIAGTKCTKLNSTKAVSNIKYTCVKSGKKLVWNKGVAVKQAILPTPAPTSSPQPIETPKVEVAPNDFCTSADQGAMKVIHQGTLICKKDAKGIFRWILDATVLQPAVTPTPAVVVNPIRIAAYQSAQSHKCATTHPNISATIQAAPNFPANLKNIVDGLLEKDFNCFNDFFDQTVNLKIFYVSESDSDFVSSKVIPVINAGDVDHMNQLMADMKSKKWGPGGMSGGFVNRGRTDDYYAMVIHVTDNYVWTEQNNKLVTHEFAHVMQHSYRAKNRNQGPDGWYIQVPDYFAEGGADALGYTFEAKSADALDRNMKEIEYNMAQDPESLRFRNVSTQSEMLKLMKELEFPKDDGSYNMQYPVGGLIGEYIIGTYGFEKYLQLIQNIGKYQIFKENLIATLGISQDKLFTDSASYVFTQWRAAMDH